MRKRERERLRRQKHAEYMRNVRGKKIEEGLTQRGTAYKLAKCLQNARAARVS
jgi:hypothetical protein